MDIQGFYRSRREILPAFAAALAAAGALWAAMESLAPRLAGNSQIYDFTALLEGCAEGSLFYRFMWLLTDYTEGTFLASSLSGAGMILAAFLALFLAKRGIGWAGTGLMAAPALFVRLFLASAAGLILGQILYGSFFAFGWIPTFAAFLAIQAYMLAFGCSVKKAAAAVAAGTIVTWPACFLLQSYVTGPLGLPAFLSVSFGLLLTVPACAAVFSRLPWMAVKEPAAQGGAAPKALSPGGFFFHRILADVGELVIWGNSLMVLGMYAGAIAGWAMNPLHPVYGNGRLPLLIAVQIVTAALSVFLWYPRWKRDGMAFTFPGIVFVSAIVTTYSAAWQVIVPTVLLGAVIFVPIMDLLLRRRPEGSRLPILFYVQLAVGPACALWSLAVLHVIQPLL